MLHSILYAYNLASPRTKSAARAGAAFLAGAALAVLATACSPAYAGAAVDTEGALLLRGDDAREIDAQAWRAWHRNQMQPNQPQTHAQQAQAATEKVAPKPI